MVCIKLPNDLARRGGTIDRAFALQEGGQISNSRHEKPRLLVHCSHNSTVKRVKCVNVMCSESRSQDTLNATLLRT